MAERAGKNEHQKALARLYSQLCYRFSRHEVWQDAIWMIACSISNAVDQRHFDEREAVYMRIVQKYDETELSVFPQIFGYIVNGMEEHPDCDFLGELYMELEMGNKQTGQFFTPYSLCRMMARSILQKDMIDAEIVRQGYISINDCACGAGATLVAAANYLKEIGFDYQRDALFVGQDIDSTTALMCYIHLSLLGCAGYVIIGDTLSEPQTGPVLLGEDSSRCWFTPMYILHSWRARRMPVQVGYEKPEEQQPTFTVSTKKKNAGQIMFNLGGVGE